MLRRVDPKCIKIESEPRLHAGRPQAGRRLDADGIGKADLGDTVAEISIVAISRVGQHDIGFDTGRTGGAKLIKCDLRLGLEDDVVGHTRFGAPGRIVNPFMRQIQAISDR
jgi:hypothetical protein